MGLLIVRIVELLIVVAPVIGLIYGGYRAVAKVRERTELDDGTGQQSDAPQSVRTSKSARWQAIMRMVREHDRTDTRWLDYEIDISKLLDYPLMTDMRDPLTQRFHRAKLRADMLRPADAGDLLGDSEAARAYLEAVEEYVTAFDVAEAEALRKRRSGFSRDEQQRLSRAHGAMRIATDSAATPQERERAFDVARRELDGLIVLPERTRAAIEGGITGELGS